MREDTKDIRKDRRNVQRDNRDIREDRKETRGDTRDIRKDCKEIQMTMRRYGLTGRIGVGIYEISGKTKGTEGTTYRVRKTLSSRSHVKKEVRHRSKANFARPVF
jgi:cytochrome c oxidase assembly protein Cox11